MNQRFSKIAFLVIILAILAAAAGYYWYQRQSAPVINSFEDCVKAGYPVQLSYPGQCTTPNGRIFVQKIEEVEISEIDTSTWKTYHNEKYGFEVKYPSNYELRDLTAANKKYDAALQLLIGICDLRFKDGCSGPTLHVYKGKYREPSIVMGTYINVLHQDELTFWMAGDRNILSTFKFIP